MTELDDKIARRRKELERYPPGDTAQAMALSNLAISLGVKFLETDDIVDIEEAFALHQSALDLRPAGHSN